MDLSELNDNNYSDQASSDKEGTFIEGNQSLPSQGIMEGKGDIPRGETLQSSILDPNIILDHLSEEDAPLGAESDASYLDENMKTRRIQTEITSEQMKAVFDTDNSVLNQSLENLNNKLFEELCDFQKLSEIQEDGQTSKYSQGTSQDARRSASQDPQTTRTDGIERSTSLRNYTYNFTNAAKGHSIGQNTPRNQAAEGLGPLEVGASKFMKKKTKFANGSRRKQTGNNQTELEVSQDESEVFSQEDDQTQIALNHSKMSAQEFKHDEFSEIDVTNKANDSMNHSLSRKETRKLKRRNQASSRVPRKHTLRSRVMRDSAELSYKVQFQKALKLVNSLQKELEEYKKISKIVQYITTQRAGGNPHRDEMTEDIKVIISDLREHIGLQENEELSMIKENFGKIINLFGASKEKTKEVEEILLNVIHSKTSKRRALRDFTDKIVTTVEEVGENKDEDDLANINTPRNRLLPGRDVQDDFKRRPITSLVNEYNNIQRKSVELGTKFNEFNLSKAGMLKVPKKLKHDADNIIEKLLKKKKLKDLMPSSQMFMIITQIHKTSRDFLEKHHPDLSVQGYVYDYIMNKYGIKKIADKKFKQL